MLAVAAASAGAGCGQANPSRSERRGEVDAGVKAAHFATPAIRCSECHGRIYDAWKRSAHARSTQSPLYKAMRADAASDADCARCHAPLRSRVGRAEPVANEGVTCDVCHTIRAVEERATGAGFALHIDDNAKYGPVCEGEAPYFHKLGCSPLHAESRFCAACHMLRLGEVPVFTEYEEWLASPQAAQGLDCQRCHMPSTLAEIAVGTGDVAGLAHHGWMGETERLRETALTARVSHARAGGELEVTAVVRNANAAHAVPTGLPGRRVLLALHTLDEAGRPVAEWSREYARVLVDRQGEEVPFYRALREREDTRLRPHEERTERARLAAPARGALRIRLIWREADPALATRIGAGAPREIVLAERVVPLDGPASVELGP